jgi:beta-mannosidase
LTGNLYSDEGFRVDIPGNSSLVYYDTLQSGLLGKLDPKGLLLLVTLKGDFPQIMAKNILFFVPPKDLDLPKTLISKKVAATKTGYTITLTSEKFARNVYLSTPVKGDFSDNYFDILPGETIEIGFTTKQKDPKMADLIKVKSLTDAY